MPRAAPAATLTLVAQSINGLPSPARIYKNSGNTRHCQFYKGAICSVTSNMKNGNVARTEKEKPENIKMKLVLSLMDYDKEKQIGKYQ